MARQRCAGLRHAVFDHYRKPRVLGLDLLRIAASSSVIVYHGNAVGVLGNNQVGSVFGNDGFLAVDMFFVLSGWLLTRQVLRMRGAFMTSWRFAATFWIRRWARTIPPYWVVLIAIFAFGDWLTRPGALPHPFTPMYEPGRIDSVGDLLRHAVFLQTILPPSKLGVSWSLVTEEWFYFLLPLVIMLAFRLRSRRSLLTLGLVVLLLPVAVRTALLLTSASWTAIKPQPIARFDGLVVGSLLAAASVRLPAWQTHVEPRRRWLFFLGCVVITLLLVAGKNDALWFQTIGLQVFNVCVGLLLPLLSDFHWRPSAPALLVMCTAFLSELTYPLYLVHTVLPTVHWAHMHGPVRFMFGFLSLSVLLAAAVVLHLGVERPFLALRARYADRGIRPGARRAQSWKEPASAQRLATTSLA
jgi:peptidoglycan/LPS O-acetylase OafA/YrhL